MLFLAVADILVASAYLLPASLIRRKLDAELCYAWRLTWLVTDRWMTLFTAARRCRSVLRAAYGWESLQVDFLFSGGNKFKICDIYFTYFQ